MVIPSFAGPLTVLITLLFQVAVTNHKAALQSELARMKVKAGAKSNKELLPEAVRNEGTDFYLVLTPGLTTKKKLLYRVL